MNIKTISDLRKALRQGPYCWPGGYPVHFVMDDGDCISFAAAKANRRYLVEALAKGWPNGWLPVACEINWENPELRCAHTGERIESAYGDD